MKGKTMKDEEHLHAILQITRRAIDVCELVINAKHPEIAKDGYKLGMLVQAGDVAGLIGNKGKEETELLALIGALGVMSDRSDEIPTPSYTQLHMSKLINHITDEIKIIDQEIEENG